MMIKIIYELIGDPIRYSLFFDNSHNAYVNFKSFITNEQDYPILELFGVKNAAGDKIHVLIPKSQVKCVQLVDIEDKAEFIEDVDKWKDDKIKELELKLNKANEVIERQKDIAKRVIEETAGYVSIDKPWFDEVFNKIINAKAASGD